MYICARLRAPMRVGECRRVRACSLVYPSCNSYAPYCDICHILRHYFIKGAIFRKNVVEHKKCVFSFSLKLLLKHFSFYNKFSEILSYMCKSLHVKYRYSCQILTKLEFFDRLSEKRSNMKFYQNPSTGSRAVPCARTDGRTDSRA